MTTTAKGCERLEDYLIGYQERYSAACGESTALASSALGASVLKMAATMAAAIERSECCAFTFYPPRAGAEPFTITLK